MSEDTRNKQDETLTIGGLRRTNFENIMFLFAKINQQTTNKQKEDTPLHFMPVIMFTNKQLRCVNSIFKKKKVCSSLLAKFVVRWKSLCLACLSPTKSLPNSLVPRHLRRDSWSMVLVLVHTLILSGLVIIPPAWWNLGLFCWYSINKLVSPGKLALQFYLGCCQVTVTSVLHACFVDLFSSLYYYLQIFNQLFLVLE